MIQEELVTKNTQLISEHLVKSIQYIKGDRLKEIKGFYIFIPSIEFNEDHMVVHGHVVQAPVQDKVDTYVKLAILYKDVQEFMYEELEYVEGEPFDENKRVMIKLMKCMEDSKNFSEVSNTYGLSALVEMAREGNQ